VTQTLDPTRAKNLEFFLFLCFVFRRLRNPRKRVMRCSQNLNELSRSVGGGALNFYIPRSIFFRMTVFEKRSRIFTPIFLHFFASELLLIISTVLGEKK
jgi:hypothetical protein